MDEQRDTLRWFRCVHYLITAVGNKSTDVCGVQWIELWSEDLKETCRSVDGSCENFRMT